MGAALCSNGNKIVQDTHVSKLKSENKNDRDEDIADKDLNGFTKSTVAREHEKLWQAVELNDLKAAEKYLDFNDIVESNLYDPFGQTMLHKAASQGSAEMFMLLLERTGAKPDLVNMSLATPLHLACRNGKDNVVRFLIGCGVEANAEDEHGQTPLLICCIHGHFEILSMLVEASNSGQLPEPLEIDLPNHQGLTPLNCAAIKGDLEMVKCLVSRGGADINQTSPKGCTPLIYAGRGGYSAVVEYLIQKKASPLKQDNAGGTILHHAIEKGHIQVLETLLAEGVDVYSAIEIADNAGRTPIFEAVENLNGSEENELSIKIIQILTQSKQQGGFAANPNVINYNGQTPLFSASRQGSFYAVKALIEAGAKPDLHNGELVKPEEDQDKDDDQESADEKQFMEAFKNCMTPLQVAVVLGYDDIVQYLALDCDANVNLQTRSKKFTTLHLSVLANKPEMIMDLLVKMGADPLLDDSSGRALLDMVYQYLPNYVETFQEILEKLNGRQKTPEVTIQDDRVITGAKTQQEIKEMYSKQMEVIEEEVDQLGNTINLAEIIEQNLLSDAENIDPRIEKVYGAKVALCLVSQNWQHKEQAIKLILKQTEKYITRADAAQSQTNTLTEIMEAAMAAVSLTCRDKVIKVFNPSLQLFNIIMQSTRIEHDMKAMGRLLSILNNEQIIQKLLLQSEQSNTRVINKIHESLLDLSYQPQLGEELVAKAVFEQIKKHNQQNQNHKGLLAQLALLYKLVNSFKVEVRSHELDDPKALSKEFILQVVLPSCSHTKDDIRGAAVRILIDVQKQSGSITLQDLQSLPDKICQSVWEKVSETQLDLQASPTQIQNNQVVNIEKDEESVKPATAVKLTTQSLEKYKQIINEKGSSKDWTQREIALNNMQECFSLDIKDVIGFDEVFLTQCSILLQTSLDDNNIQIYLIAIEVVSLFIQKVSGTESLLDALPQLLQSVVLRTTDTNTRVRKRSVDLINQVWDIQLNKKANLTASQIVANILCEPSLNEKAIVGRLGLFIKKTMLIESAQDISKKPLQLILGKDYEMLAQFACQWCLHKNTKVRQCALKLTVEICRLNSIDPRGIPFKQRITNFILGLRASIRDPLVKKINEVCSLANPDLKETFINEQEIELTQATKARAASYDVRRTVNRPTQQTGTLPQIGGGITLPSVVAEVRSGTKPTIVLPHSEPLSEAQIEQSTILIELFGKELVTCFYSQTWSSRFAAIQKVEEQLHNLDPKRRDAMYAEINRDNLPPEVSFKTILKFFEEGLKDPVLKNYITLLDLIQTALPIYFRYLRPEQIRRELQPLIVIIVNKTSDLKQKVREASMNLCLYLSHQVEIGSEPMIQLILKELDQLQWDKQDTKKEVQNTFGNSNMIVSCLNLLAQFQLQTSLVTKQSSFYDSYALNINKALKHSNPQVRKEGEALFKIMFATFGDDYTQELKDQKSQVVTKLIQDAKAEKSDTKSESKSATTITTTETKTIIRDDFLAQSQIVALLKGNEEKLQQLKQPNPKKRLIAIVEIKKVIQQKIIQLNTQSARDLVEPLSQLLRHLLRDENVEVFLESLNLLKFIVGNLAQHLSALDLHLMMGQFIAVIVSGQNSNMKARIASDKVIVYFAKHTNIGSLVVAKEVLKNIERLNKSAWLKSQSIVEESADEKRNILSRFYGILQMLLQQFSIVLCYQPDFYQKCLDLLSETMSKCSEEPVLKSTCTQLVISLHQIDSKLLDQGVQQLDFTKKTHLKKIIIELENSTHKGLMNQNQNLVSGVNSGQRPGSPDASFRDTQQSFTSLNSRTSIMSPGGALNMNRRLQRDRNSEVRTSKGNIQETPDQLKRGNVEAQSLTGMGWLERKNIIDPSNTTTLLPQINSDSNQTKQRRQVGQGFIGASSKPAGFNRNEFNMTGEVLNNRKGGINDFTVNSGIMSSQKKSDDDPSRIPMYVPTQRNLAPRKAEGYQPTILSRLNSDNDSSNRNKPIPLNIVPNNENRQNVVQQQSVLKPPPAATIEVKKIAEYSAVPTRKNSFY